jgi:hypothetical protein
MGPEANFLNGLPAASLPDPSRLYLLMAPGLPGFASQPPLVTPLILTLQIQRYGQLVKLNHRQPRQRS